MGEENRSLLEEEIKAEIKRLGSLESGSQEHTTAVDSLTKLYKLKLEEDMAENAIKGTNDSDNIVQLMAGQETGDSQQLAIMEAIADLYDAVAAMIPE